MQGYCARIFNIHTNMTNIGISAIDWSTQELTPFKKCFYQENEETSNQTGEQIAEWKKSNDIECYLGFKNLESKHEVANQYHIIFDDSSDSSEKSKSVDNDDSKTDKESQKPKTVPKPVMSFDSVGFPKSILAAIKKAEFKSPTPIQSAAWPMLLSGNNVVGIAQTGSGKTVSFLLPGIVHILNNQLDNSNNSNSNSNNNNSNDRKKGNKFNHYNNRGYSKYQRGYSSPQALIIAPTRELACQIEAEFIKFGKNSGIKHCCVYGGVKKFNQERSLKNGVDIIIATPGRLLDFSQSGMITFENISYVVIDEADRLLDMGFEPQLNIILSQIRPDRQLSMFSATWPKSVHLLAKKYLANGNDDSNIMQVTIGQVSDGLKANENVTQIVDIMTRFAKIDNLKKRIDEQLKKDEKSKILVFVSTKKMTKMLETILWDAGYYVTCMHGDKEQKQRDKALNDFKKGAMQIMLATDVASRGIHVNDIVLVINFDFPMKIEDYIHRIGRTGRANKKGTAISFFVEEFDGCRARDLIKIMQDANQKVSQELMKLQWSRGGKGGRSGGSSRRSRAFRRY